MGIMQRHAADDFEAFLTAQAMEEAGAEVFSITFNGMHRKQGALADTARMVVWARVTDDVQITKADEAIEKAFAKVYGE
jgi:enoyl-[acyl-carrier-protein] reductase (NADH)